MCARGNNNTGNHFITFVLGGNMTLNTIYSILGFGSLITALIPAILAKHKHRSFILFYLFGVVLFIPALIVSIIISDPYDPAIVRGRGIWIVVAIIAFINIFKFGLKPFSNYYESLLLKTDLIPNTPKHDSALILGLALFLLLSIILSIVIADIISLPITTILFSFGNSSRRYADPSRPVRIFKGVLFGIFFYRLLGQEQIERQNQAFHNKYPNGRPRL